MVVLLRKCNEYWFRFVRPRLWLTVVLLPCNLYLWDFYHSIENRVERARSSLLQDQDHSWFGCWTRKRMGSFSIEVSTDILPVPIELKEPQFSCGAPEILGNLQQIDILLCINHTDSIPNTTNIMQTTTLWHQCPMASPKSDMRCRFHDSSQHYANHRSSIEKPDTAEILANTDTIIH